ncbi:FtsK/SpoIIIE domain-containing protein [Pararhodobacter sp. SW119]|uniref:FtsK/SpoIIIE domain-containing protein n=1 Tax=Pararhodobacter sp. SW119 TaxID=2780075 RepID=UPI001ADEC092|nr:FtsK/SpoIIIE domain-containing protein [Pararhodobacter sp. SW119]
MIDPIGLGQNFSSFHELADYDEKLISNKVWTNKRQIKEQLEKIVEHIEGVVQKYLRSDYQTIDEYNEAAGAIAEPFRFVLIHGFPENFDTDSVLALERIMENGPRCGVHVCLVRDDSKEPPYGTKIDTLLKTANTFRFENGHLCLVSSRSLRLPALYFQFSKAVDPSHGAEIVSSHGRAAGDGARVEVPYDKMIERVFDENLSGLQGISGRWQARNSHSLRAPLGPTGARKLQQLVLGEKGTTAHHALLVGKTGSGKSNLLHVLIMSMAELYSPKDLQVMLVDFKKGVEFKDYATHKLPHASVVAIESEKEFGLSVLKGMDAELTRRGDLFRDAGVQDLPAYRDFSEAPLPRILLIVDEFHELFVDEDTSSREAVGRIERIVRQGRSFGMHLILASQSISGVQLPRSILEQIGVRIAMQCSDSDSRLILADDNTAARLLDRAGEAIYNDKNGLVEGNNVFQTALLQPEERITRLQALRKRALEVFEGDQEIKDGPFVFEGNEPASLEFCRTLNSAFKGWPALGGTGPTRLWVGEPIAMLPTHAIELKRQSGANVLILDRDEKIAFGAAYAALLSIAAQETPESVVIHFVDLSSADADWAEHPEIFEETFPHPLTVYSRREIEGLVKGLASEVESRVNAEGSKHLTKVFFFLFGIQRARDLRQSDSGFFLGGNNEESVHGNLKKILREGPEFGVHTIIWCDTPQNAAKILDSQAMNELGQRLSGPMSSSDSMRLFDDTVASKLSRGNRMICYDDEKVGVFTQIRPFLPPDTEWLVKLSKEVRETWIGARS